MQRALVDAKKNIVLVPLVGAGTIPHKSQSKYHAAKVVIVPASDGTGVIAGGSIKSVLELAGVQNVLAKRLGCRSALNNARATVKAMQQLKTLNEVSKARGVPMSRLLLEK
jgi:small subunit ribosomal protein S5